MGNCCGLTKKAQLFIQLQSGLDTRGAKEEWTKIRSGLPEEFIDQVFTVDNSEIRHKCQEFLQDKKNAGLLEEIAAVRPREAETIAVWCTLVGNIAHVIEEGIAERILKKELAAEKKQKKKEEEEEKKKKEKKEKEKKEKEEKANSSSSRSKKETKKEETTIVLTKEEETKKKEDDDEEDDKEKDEVEEKDEEEEEEEKEDEKEVKKEFDLVELFLQTLLDISYLDAALDDADALYCLNGALCQLSARDHIDKKPFGTPEFAKAADRILRAILKLIEENTKKGNSEDLTLTVAYVFWIRALAKITEDNLPICAVLGTKEIVEDMVSLTKVEGFKTVSGWFSLACNLSRDSTSLAELKDNEEFVDEAIPAVKEIWAPLTKRVYRVVLIETNGCLKDLEWNLEKK